MFSHFSFSATIRSIRSLQALVSITSPRLGLRHFPPLRHQSPKASLNPPKHCVHTTLFILQNTFWTTQHVVKSIHCTICNQAITLMEYLPILPCASIFPMLHGEYRPHYVFILKKLLYIYIYLACRKKSICLLFDPEVMCTWRDMIGS